MHTFKRRPDFKSLPAFVFIMSCLFLTVLLSTIQRDVFFSGDGGLKYLVTKQPADYTTLHLKTPDWVGDIWNQGFYPFKAPFVYDSLQEKIISFPPFFQQLSAPLYQKFGYAGLYCIPVFSILALWVWFTWLLYHLRIKPVIIAVVLFCLLFCSPLTLYAAVYWEHTLAVLLLFAGIVFLVKPTGKPLTAITLGSLTGFSAWLRPEALLLSLMIAALVLYNRLRQERNASLYFVVSLFVTIVLFFVCNRFTYGDFLGAHSYQLFLEASLREKIHQSLVLLIHLNGKQLIFFPIQLLVFSLVMYARVKKAAVPKQVLQLLLITVLFSFIAPFFLPNAGGKQWGPRYFLFLIPIVLLAFAIFANSFSSFHNVVKVGPWLMLPFVAFSVYLNSYLAFKTLHNDYAFRVKPCLQFIQHDSCKVVVVQNQFIAQEFAALFDSKSIFLAENRSQYDTLQTLLHKARVEEVIFISRDRDLLLPCQPNEPGSNHVQHIGDYFLTRCKWPL